MEDTTPASELDVSLNPSSGDDSTTTNANVDPASQSGEQSDKRIQNAVAAVEKKNEEVRTLLEVQADMVRDNPEYIARIAERDPSLADRVVEKVWGEDGIRSYSQLIKRAEQEKIKDSQPELYATNIKLQEMEDKLKQREMKDKAIASQNFFAAKGIIPNEYDENYKKVTENLKYINPQVIEQDYEKALTMAYNLSFEGGRPQGQNVNAPSLPPIGHGANQGVFHNTKPQFSETTQWLAQGMGVDLSK